MRAPSACKNKDPAKYCGKIYRLLELGLSDLGDEAEGADAEGATEGGAGAMWVRDLDGCVGKRRYGMFMKRLENVSSGVLAYNIENVPLHLVYLAFLYVIADFDITTVPSDIEYSFAPLTVIVSSVLPLLYGSISKDLINIHLRALCTLIMMMRRWA